MLENGDRLRIFGNQEFPTALDIQIETATKKRKWLGPQPPNIKMNQKNLPCLKQFSLFLIHFFLLINLICDLFHKPLLGGGDKGNNLHGEQVPF